jgi:hypothetical protein
MSSGRMIDEKGLEGNSHGLFEVLSQHMPGGTEENYLVLVRFRTEHLANTVLRVFHQPAWCFCENAKLMSGNLAQVVMFLSCI